LPTLAAQRGRRVGGAVEIVPVAVSRRKAFHDLSCCFALGCVGELLVDPAEELLDVVLERICRATAHVDIVPPGAGIKTPCYRRCDVSRGAAGA
jgi:hypothetical protein